MKQCRVAGIACFNGASTSRYIPSQKMFTADVPCGQCHLLKDFSGEAYSYQGPFGNMSNFFLLYFVAHHLTHPLRICFGLKSYLHY